MLRRATPTDVGPIVDVFERSFATLDFLPALHTREEHLAFFGRCVAGGETWVWEDGQIAAFAVLRDEELSHLYVAPEAFGQGIGSALLAKAKEHRPDGFTLWVFQQNERARRFYERRGLRCVRTTDGRDNEERTPDALYAWHPAAAANAV